MIILGKIYYEYIFDIIVYIFELIKGFIQYIFLYFGLQGYEKLVLFFFFYCIKIVFLFFRFEI